MGSQAVGEIGTGETEDFVDAMDIELEVLFQHVHVVSLDRGAQHIGPGQGADALVQFIEPGDQALAAVAKHLPQHAVALQAQLGIHKGGAL